MKPHVTRHVIQDKSLRDHFLWPRLEVTAARLAPGAGSALGRHAGSNRPMVSVGYALDPGLGRLSWAGRSRRSLPAFVADCPATGPCDFTAHVHQHPAQGQKPPSRGTFGPVQCVINAHLWIDVLTLDV